MKEKVKRVYAVRGQRATYCQQCNTEHKDDKRWYPSRQAMRALYIRVPLKGFKRIGWLYEACGHVVIGGELKKAKCVDGSDILIHSPKF